MTRTKKADGSIQRPYVAVHEYDPCSRSWGSQVRDVPKAHTWGRTLAESRRNAVDALATVLGLDADQAAALHVEHVLDLEGDLGDRVAEVTRKRAAAEALTREAGDLTPGVLRELVDGRGLTLRDAAAAVGLSFQRVQQILRRTDVASAGSQR